MAMYVILSSLVGRSTHHQAMYVLVRSRTHAYNYLNLVDESANARLVDKSSVLKKPPKS